MAVMHIRCLHAGTRMVLILMGASCKAGTRWEALAGQVLPSIKMQLLNCNPLLSVRGWQVCRWDAEKGERVMKKEFPLSLLPSAAHLL